MGGSVSRSEMNAKVAELNFNHSVDMLKQQQQQQQQQQVMSMMNNSSNMNAMFAMSGMMGGFASSMLGGMSQMFMPFMQMNLLSSMFGRR